MKLPEVAHHGDSKCKSCHACLCAVKRFLKANGARVVQVTKKGRTDFFWAAEPERAAA